MSRSNHQEVNLDIGSLHWLSLRASAITFVYASQESFQACCHENLDCERRCQAPPRASLLKPFPREGTQGPPPLTCEQFRLSKMNLLMFEPIVSRTCPRPRPAERNLTRGRDGRLTGEGAC
jgi:hypothetical protein